MQYYITETSCERTDFFRVKKRGERIQIFYAAILTHIITQRVFIQKFCCIKIFLLETFRN